MRKRFATLVTLALVALGTLGIAPSSSAQTEDPCAFGPGYAGFGAFHAELAMAGELGAGGHIPGEHRGVAGFCGVAP
ncbi:MAG: hypothetical protein ICV71_07745 [Thermoleophilia bacterium]|nr:hypothetical protein [Thermoleophilia bacterium]